MPKKPRNSHIRYIEFIDGEFTETLHNKESYHLATQSKERDFCNDDLMESLDVQQESKIEQVMPEKTFSWIRALFILFLIFMFGLIVFSFSKQWNHSASFIETAPTELITDLSNDEQEKVVGSEILNNLTYNLHTHHAINNAYETVKLTVKEFSTGKISWSEKENQITDLISNVQNLLAYNESQSQKYSVQEYSQLYSITQYRLQHLELLLGDIGSINSRNGIVESLNKGIESDAPFFNTQVSNFKGLLNAYNIPYTETDGQLNFVFPN